MSHILKENDNIYVNVVFDNLSTGATGSTERAIPMEYNVTKTLPILDKASDYYCSVIRFDIPLSSVPILIVPIIPNQVNSNLTPWVIGIAVGGTNFSNSIIYTTNDLSVSVPTQNQLTQVITPYYFVYDFQNIINNINYALQQSFNDAAKPGGGNDAPFFIYDSQTQLVSLIASAAFVGSGAVIYFNEYLLLLLDAFQLNFNGVDKANGRDYDMLLTPYQPGGYPYPINAIAYNTFGYPSNSLFPAAPTYFQFTQQYSTIANWFSLRKIIISTNGIPINTEYIPSYNPNGSQNNVAASFPILTDYTLPLEYTNQVRSVAYYVPSSQYRLVDLISDTPLNKIDLKIYWVDKLGNLYPLYLLINQQASVKLGFFRKTLYKGGKSLLYK